MKVLALMGSPREGSNTDIIVDRILAGASSEGAEIEKFTVKDIHVIPCDGCMDCRKSGKCEDKDDDVLRLAQRIDEADAIVIGSPIYGNHLPGQFKMFFDRLTGLTHKNEMRSGKFVSVSRLKEKKRNVVILGVAGAPTPESCDQTIRYLTRVFMPELNGGQVYEMRAISLSVKRQIAMSHEELTEYARTLRYPNIEEVTEKMSLQNDEYLKQGYKIGKELINSLKSS